MNSIRFAPVALSLLLVACASSGNDVTATHVENHIRPDISSMHAHDDHATMTMDDMVRELEGKTGDRFDEAFVRGMIPHHQGAIDMAEMALQNAKHEEIKQMARDIISAQQKEIDMMNRWLHDWGYQE